MFTNLSAYFYLNYTSLNGIMIIKISDWNFQELIKVEENYAPDNLVNL